MVATKVIILEEDLWMLCLDCEGHTQMFKADEYELDNIVHQTYFCSTCEGTVEVQIRVL